MRQQYVYFAFHRKTNRVKIGLSINPTARVAFLLFRGIELLGVINGDRDTERQLHARFVDLLDQRDGDGSGKTEWFKATSELLSYIKSVASTLDGDNYYSRRTVPAETPQAVTLFAVPPVIHDGIVFRSPSYVQHLTVATLKDIPPLVVVEDPITFRRLAVVMPYRQYMIFQEAAGL